VTLRVLGGPKAQIAAAAIDRALNDGGALVGLEEHERDAVFAVLEDCPDGLAELGGALLRDFEHRHRGAL
jgi:hypothetical protein